LLLALISAFPCAPASIGKAYKCVAEDGSIAYQQTPCCEEEQEEETAYPDFLNGKDGHESVHADSIKKLKNKSNIQHLETKKRK